MIKRTIVFLVALAIVYFAYEIFGIATGAQRAGIPVWSALFKAESCEREPTSECFAELALVSIRPHHSLQGLDDVGLAFRFLGYGEIAEQTDTNDGRRSEDSYRNAQIIYEEILNDTEHFLTKPPIDDVGAYAVALYFVQGDPSYFLSRNQEIDAIEDAARAQRPYTPVAAPALVRKWRESLDQYGGAGYEWMNFAIRLRESGMPDKAKAALAKAEEIGLSDISRIRGIGETWHLFGNDAAAEVVDTFADTNLRAEAHLKLADLALQSGDAAWSATAFERFVANYDREKPIRHRVLWGLMARRAANVANAVGDREQAEVWADTYAKETSFYSIPDRVRYSGELYADVQLFEKSAAIARQAIAEAPAPDSSPWARFLGLDPGDKTAIHNAVVGRAAGLLCRSGDFEAAFALTEANPAYGPHAAIGCFTAIESRNTLSRVSELERRLGQSSIRQLRTAYARSLITRGDYQQAAEVIEQTIDFPPVHDRSSRANENVQLLRLALAMCDDELAREVMQSIARDADSISGIQAIRVFTAVASYTKGLRGCESP